MYYLLPEEIVALFTVLYKRSRRDHMLFLTMLTHGLRVSDAISLTSNDVQGTSLVVNKNYLKGNSAQLQPLYLSDNILFDERALAIHAGQIAGNSVLKDKRLFPISRQRVDQLVKQYGALAGIPRVKCRSHAVGRHSCAMLTWNASHSLSQVQQVLGHKSPASSLIYLAESDKTKGIASLAKALAGLSQ